MRPTDPSLRSHALTLCALSVLVWWGSLYGSAVIRDVFFREGSWLEVQRFLPADLTLAAVTFTAALRVRRATAPTVVGALAVGGWGYATVWTAVAVVGGALHWPSLLLMGLGFLVVCASVFLVSQS